MGVSNAANRKFGKCIDCQTEQPLKKDGTVGSHQAWRMGHHGIERSRCPGSGELPMKEGY